MPRRLSGKPSKQSRNDPSRVSSGRIHAPDRIPRFLRIPNLPLERGFIPTVAFGTHRNGRNRDSFAFTAFRRLVETSPRSKRRRHGPLLSWSGSSGPSVAARAGGDGPDKPGHDAEGAPSIRLNQPAEGSSGTSGPPPTGPGCRPAAA